MANIDNLMIYYQNVRGLRTETNTFIRNLMASNYDLICLTETWLLPGIFDAELFDVRYSVYRFDRDYASRGDRTGGGVLVAVHRRLTVTGFSTIAMVDWVADSLCVSIFINKDTFLNVYCGYFPHCHLQFEVMNSFFEVIADRVVVRPCDRFLVVGGAGWQTSSRCTLGGEWELPQLRLAPTPLRTVSDEGNS